MALNYSPESLKIFDWNEWICKCHLLMASSHKQWIPLKSCGVIVKEVICMKLLLWRNKDHKSVHNQSICNSFSCTDFIDYNKISWRWIIERQWRDPGDLSYSFLCDGAWMSVNKGDESFKKCFKSSASPSWFFLVS